MAPRLLITALLLAHSGFAAPAGAPLSLDKLLKNFAEDPDQGRGLEPISPEWIGTVKTVYTKDYKDPGPPEHIRFTHGGVLQHSKLQNEKRAKNYAIIARMRGKSYLGSEGPEYYQSLPDLKTVSRCAKGSELEKLFGPNRGWTSGWGGPDRWHWSVGWTCFTKSKAQQLRYLAVFALVSAPEKAKDYRIDSMIVREGFFRPADPKSAKEKAKYLHGDILVAREKAAQKAARNKYPRPLRDLLAADEAPNDSDLSIYGNFLHKFRTEPDPKLIEQILAHAHENSTRYQGFLEGIFTNRISSIVAELEEWQPAKKKKALGYLIDKLPATKDDDALEDALEVALQSLGGGKLDLKALDGKRRIDLEIKVKKKGKTTSYGRVDHYLPLIEQAQKELRALINKRLP